jgi:hypothetical protein
VSEKDNWEENKARVIKVMKMTPEERRAMLEPQSAPEPPKHCHCLWPKLELIYRHKTFGGQRVIYQDGERCTICGKGKQ